MTRGSESQKLFKKRHPERVKPIQIRNAKKRRAKNRENVIIKYGGICSCSCGCKERNLRFLTFDHIHGRELEITEHGKRLTPGQIVSSLKRSELNPEFRILCYNCNCFCNRQTLSIGTSRKVTRAREWRLEIKKQLLEKYGGCCECCSIKNFDFLTFDYINDDGSKTFKHKNNRGRYTFKFLLFLRKQEERASDIRILCYNCNCSRRYHDDLCSH
jgi:hypothetical protein